MDERERKNDDDAIEYYNRIECGEQCTLIFHLFHIYAKTITCLLPLFAIDDDTFVGTGSVNDDDDGGGGGGGGGSERFVCGALVPLRLIINRRMTITKLSLFACYQFSV